MNSKSRWPACAGLWAIWTGALLASFGCEAPTPPDRKVYKPRIVKSPKEEAQEKKMHPAAMPLPVGTPVKIENLADGSGTEAVDGSSCTVNYVGWLADGTEFDSGDFTFVLGKGQVIKGWDQGILGMKVGEKRRLTISPDLAYGKQGRAPYIPPDSTLVFEVELKEVK